jgi:hypothetical protein
MPGDEFHLRHVSLRIDDAIEYHDSLRSRLSRQRRVDRLYVGHPSREAHKQPQYIVMRYSSRSLLRMVYRITIYGRVSAQPYRITIHLI